MKENLREVTDPDMDRAWNNAAGEVWRQLDPELWEITHGIQPQRGRFFTGGGRSPHENSAGKILEQLIRDKLVEHKKYIDKYGQDIPEIRELEKNNPW